MRRSMVVAPTWLAIGLLAQPLLVQDASPPGSELAWWSLRAADRLAQNLEDLGVDVGAPRATRHAPHGFRVVESDVRFDEGAPNRARWTVQAGPHAWSWSGAPDELEAAAASAAVSLAGSLGVGVPPDARTLLRSGLPMPVSQLMGRARQRELEGGDLQAALMFERASRLGDAFWYEALAGAIRAREAHARTSVRASRPADPELAKAAAVRATVAQRSEDAEAEASAWRAFSKYTPHRLRPWSVAWPAPSGVRIAFGRDHVWIDDGNRRARLPLVGGRGPDTTAPSSGSRMLAAGPDFIITRTGDGLERRDGPVVRWRAKMPVRQVVGVRVASGFVGVWGPEGGAWLDAGLGQVRNRFSGSVLADDDRGVLVRTDEGVAFVRAGQEVPAWTRPPVDAAALTDERVLAISTAGVQVLRAQTGQAVGEPIDVGERSLLHASGRVAVFAGSSDYQVVDILAGVAHPPQVGPGRPIAATRRMHGVAVGFDRGDVFLADHRGVLERRVVLPRPAHRLEVREEFQIIVAFEAYGVHAIGDVRADEITDVDALLALARLAQDQGRADDALRLADWALRSHAGPIAAISRVRAELLPAGPARERAAARAEAAGDVQRSLGEFRGLGLSVP